MVFTFQNRDHTRRRACGVSRSSVSNLDHFIPNTELPNRQGPGKLLFSGLFDVLVICFFEVFGLPPRRGRGGAGHFKKVLANADFAYLLIAGIKVK
jgi:hypothetical protein